MAARVNTKCAVQSIDRISCDHVEFSKVAVCKGQGFENNKSVLVVGGGNFIYLYRNHQRKVIFKFADAVQSFAVTQSEPDQRNRLWCLTGGGKLHSVDINRYLKKKKRKHKKKSTKENVTSDVNTSNQDIFTGLLVDSPMVGEANDIDVEIEVSSDRVIEVGERNLCLHINDMKDFLLFQDYVIAATKREQSLHIAIFSSDSLVQCDDVEETAAADNNTPLHKVDIPYPQSTNERSSASLSLDLFTPSQSKDLFAEDDSGNSCTVVGIVPSGGLAGTRMFSERIISVEPELFTTLFGADNCVIDSPVILVGLHDGKIYYYPLKNIARTDRLISESEKLSQMPFCTSTVFPLYNLQQCLINIHGVHLPNKAEQSDSSANEETGIQNCCNALLLVGKDGKIVVVSTTKGKLDFKEYIVKGPVSSSCVNGKGDLLMYSTQADLYLVNLVNRQNDSRQGSANSESKTQSEAVLPNVLTPCSTGLARIESASYDQEGNVYAIRNNGQIVSITLETGDHGDNLSLSMPPSVAGQRMKEVLAGISHTAEKLAKMNLTLKTQDEVLKELHLAADLTCSMYEGDSSKTLESQFPCTTQCVIQDMGYRFNYGLTVKLQNASSSVLSSWAWMVCVQRHGNCKSLSYQLYTKTVSLDQFQPSDFREIYIPLDDSMQGCLPVTVKCYLHFDLHHLHNKLSLANDVSRESHLTLTSNGICLPVGSSELDILHLLRPVARQGAGSSSVTLVSCSSWGNRLQRLTGQLKEIQSQRPESVSDLEEINLVSTVTSKVLISAGYVDHSGVIQDQNVVGSKTAESMLLRQLLQGNPKVEEIFPSDKSTLQLVAPSGDSVILQCHRVTVADREVLELTISADSLHLLCQLHEGALRRIQC
ncbi:Fanconi anemia core complex-associated protein 100-like isoform X2 [Ptychodera flava]|uniref:Fanconi anemia core complex-associated protein 100-like isoform X2 n=1 Tax=Ptychodera flava TaxID=63121 RepID=UPI00396A2836